MVVYVDNVNNKQMLMSSGKVIDDIKSIIDMKIKNVKYIDGKIVITLKEKRRL